MKRWIFCITLLSLSLAGCTSTKATVDTENLNDLENLTFQQLSSSAPTVGKIRIKALKETALTIGAQSGLAYRSKQIDQTLDQNNKQLSQIFNFNGLMLNHNILPPVLTQSNQSLNLSSPDVIRISDHTYKIIQQARFVTTPPTWRDYLWLNFTTPTLPDRTLLPKNDQEREIWVNYIDLGWQNGIKQADDIYANGLAALQRDYKGMMLYRELLDQNMVSKPFVASSNMGITSNENNTEIRINDQVLRITAEPSLKANSKQWKPVLITK